MSKIEIINRGYKVNLDRERLLSMVGRNIRKARFTGKEQTVNTTINSMPITIRISNTISLAVLRLNVIEPLLKTAYGDK